MSNNTADRVNNFNRLYDALDEETQIKLDHFIAGIEEVGQNMVGETIYNGDMELLYKFMPCLQSISSTITYCKIDVYENKYIHKLQWSPNDFIIPPNVLVRANERYEIIQSGTARITTFE
jgi:hypothetical protein